MKCHSAGDQLLTNLSQCENFLHLGTCNNFHDVFGLQKYMLSPLCQMCPELLSNVFIINNGPSFLAQLVERKVTLFQEIQDPLADALHVVFSTYLCLGNNF